MASERTRRWAFVPSEILKNLAMGSSAVRSIRGSRTVRPGPNGPVEAAQKACAFYLGQMRRLSPKSSFLQGKRVVEIGPGSNLIVLLWFLANGARQAEAIDRFVDLLPPGELAQLHARAVASWSPDMKARVEDLLAWRSPGKEGERLRHWHFPIEAAPDSLRGAYDLIVSHNALEHVSAVRTTMQSLYRLLAADGLMVHRINCATQGVAGTFGAGELNRFAFGRRLWQLMYSNRGGTNQECMGTYLRECEVAGFKDIQTEVLQSLTDEEVESLRPLLHPAFRDRDASDLKVLSFVLTARKG